jgi:hypothetical protein
MHCFAFRCDVIDVLRVRCLFMLRLRRKVISMTRFALEAVLPSWSPALSAACCSDTVALCPVRPFGAVVARANDSRFALLKAWCLALNVEALTGSLCAFAGVGVRPLIAISACANSSPLALFESFGLTLLNNHIAHLAALGDILPSVAVVACWARLSFNTSSNVSALPDSNAVLTC